MEDCTQPPEDEQVTDNNKGKRSQLSRFIRCLNKHDGIVTAISAIVTAISTIFIAVFTSTIKTESYNQSLIAAAEQRPWVVVNEIVPVSVGNATSFNLEIDNIGKTPNSGLYGVADIVKDSDWDNQAYDACEKAKSHAVSDSGFRVYATFPNRGGEIPGHDMAAVAERAHSPLWEVANTFLSDGLYKKAIIGCIVYGAQFDSNLHQTPFGATLSWENGASKVAKIKILRPD